MSIQIQFTSLKDVRRVKKNNKAKLIIYSILLFIIVVNILGLYVGNIFYKKAFEIDTKKDVDQYEMSKSTFNERRFSSLQREEVSISSKKNYKLYGTYIRNPKATKDTIILVHGLTGSRWTVLKYSDMYLDKGFNILIYDSKDHGHSGGNEVTYGFDEQYDLDSWVKWVYSRNKGGIIGVHGESLGAATALLHSKLNEDKKRVSFYISDSAYSDLNELFTERIAEDFKIKNKLVADILLFYGEKVNQLRNKFKFKDASPKYIIKDVSTPILFIHGDKDNYIPKGMSEDLYKLKEGSKGLYIAPNSTHIQSYINNIDEYRDKVFKFIDENVNAKK